MKRMIMTLGKNPETKKGSSESEHPLSKMFYARVLNRQELLKLITALTSVGSHIAFDTCHVHEPEDFYFVVVRTPESEYNKVIEILTQEMRELNDGKEVVVIESKDLILRNDFDFSEIYEEEKHWKKDNRIDNDNSKMLILVEGNKFYVRVNTALEVQKLMLFMAPWESKVTFDIFTLRNPSCIVVVLKFLPSSDRRSIQKKLEAVMQTMNNGTPVEVLPPLPQVKEEEEKEEKEREEKEEIAFTPGKVYRFVFTKGKNDAKEFLTFREQFGLKKNFGINAWETANPAHAKALHEAGFEMWKEL